MCVCPVCLPSICTNSLALAHRIHPPLASSHRTFHDLDLMCGEGRSRRASCLTFTAFWLNFTRHRRAQTEGDAYRNATRHQHFCQYGRGRSFRARSSKVSRNPKRRIHNSHQFRIKSHLGDQILFYFNCCGFQNRFSVIL